MSKLNEKLSLLRRFNLNKGDLSSALKVISIVAIVTAFFWQDLSAVFTSSLVDSEVSYYLAIPVLFFFLVYRKRKILSAVISKQFSDSESRTSRFPLVCGILLLAISVFVYWYGSNTFSPLEYHMITLPLFSAALILILFNFEAIRQLAFPLAFLFFLTPPPATVL